MLLIYPKMIWVIPLYLLIDQNYYKIGIRSTRSGIYVYSFILIYVADTSIGIFTKDKAPDVLPPTCILEATEKEKNVPVKPDVVSFTCFFGDNIVEGQYYNFVQRLSNDMIWLVNLEDGQNVILPRALCQIYPSVKPVFN